MHSGVLILTVTLAVIQSVDSQGCTRVFARFQPSIGQSEQEEKSDQEIANAALSELCQGVCTLNYEIPESCPLVTLSITSSEISGFAFLPTYEMTLLATTDDLKQSKIFEIYMIFDFNSFSNDVYIQEFKINEVEEKAPALTPTPTSTPAPTPTPASTSTPAPTPISIAPTPTPIPTPTPVSIALTPSLTPTNNFEFDNIMHIQEPQMEPEFESDLGSNLIDEIEEVAVTDTEDQNVQPFSFVLGDLNTITVQVSEQGK